MQSTDGALSLEEFRQLIGADSVEYVPKGNKMDLTEKMKARLVDLTAKRVQLIAAMQQLEAQREQLAGVINAHNGAIEQIEDLLKEPSDG